MTSEEMQMQMDIYEGRTRVLAELPKCRCGNDARYDEDLGGLWRYVCVDCRVSDEYERLMLREEVPFEVELRPEVVEMWTNAPAAYDGFGTRTREIDEENRRVEIVKEHLDWQVMRYYSGGYYCCVEGVKR